MSARRQIDRLRSDAIWVETFRRKIKRNPGPLDTPCWEWQGGLDKSGYGRLHIKRYHETGKGRNFIAHRLSYMIFTGAFIEPEEYILHQCHNRLCCNPDHFKYIKSYSPYHNIKKMNYPNLLLVTNLKDVRVIFDEPTKFTAKLRQYKTDKNLLLLKCELEDAGHGGKSGRDSAIEEIAFDYSFILKITNKLNT